MTLRLFDPISFVLFLLAELTDDKKGKKNTKSVAKKSRISMPKKGCETGKEPPTQSSDSWSLYGEGSSTQQSGVQNQFIFQLQFIFNGKRTIKRRNRLAFPIIKSFKHIFGNIDWKSKPLEEAFRSHGRKQQVGNQDRPMKHSEEKSLNVSDEFYDEPEKAAKPKKRVNVISKSGQASTLKFRNETQPNDRSRSRNPRGQKDPPKMESNTTTLKMTDSSSPNTRNLRRRNRGMNYEESSSDSEKSDSDTSVQNTPLADSRKRKMFKKKKESKCFNKRWKKSSPREDETQNSKGNRSSKKHCLLEPSVTPMSCKEVGLLNRSLEVPELQEEFDLNWDTICDEALSLKEMFLSKGDLDYLSPKISEESKGKRDSLEESKGKLDSSTEESNDDPYSSTHVMLDESNGNADSSIIKPLEESNGNLDSSIPEILEESKGKPDSSIPKILEESIGNQDLAIPETLEEMKGHSDYSIPVTLEESKGNLASSVTEVFDPETPSCYSDNPIPSQTIVQAFQLVKRLVVEKISPCVCSEFDKSGSEFENGQSEKSSINLFCFGCTVFKSNLS